MKQYFIGLPLPGQLSETVKKFRRDWQYGNDKPRTEPHITLFPPFKSSGTNWLATVKASTSQVNQIEIKVQQPELFFQKVFHLPLESENLQQIYHQFRENLPKTDIELGNRPSSDYDPHITLAINRSRFSEEAVKKMKAEVDQKIPNLPQFTADKLQIYIRPQAGQPYDVFQDIDLDTD